MNYCVNKTCFIITHLIGVHCFNIFFHTLRPGDVYAPVNSVIIDSVNTLRPRQHGRHLADDMFRCIFFNENVWNLLKISLMFVPKGRMNNISALVQIMAWRRPGVKPLSEHMIVSLLTNICVTRPQWVKSLFSLACMVPCHYWSQWWPIMNWTFF